MKTKKDYELREEFEAKFNDDELFNKFLIEHNLTESFEEWKEKEFQTWRKLNYV